MQVKEYALYKGDELLAMGTKREIAEQLGVSASTVGYYGTPVYARRTSDNGRRLNDAINELHRLRGVKYRNARKYKVEMVECDGN